ncbi:MAG: aminotransferase class I/II-fold pyridoxal phosphate-dependent enzyme [Rhodobacterales bacterium]|nr:aminotransferase class I/II-fold pyridoxal phosphate-dependent enzyme [Rhodobacterales bacterium]
MKHSVRGNIDPFIVMDVMEKARKAEENGRKIIHLEVGQPSTAIPFEALKRTSDTMKRDPLGYTVALGLPELRKKISGLYGRWYNLDLDPARVVITSGSSGAFILSFISLFDVAARVGIGAPGYPSYRQILKSLGILPVDIKTSLENKFQPTKNDILSNSLDGLLVASPSNPSGTMLDQNELAELIETSKSVGANFISDEIYHGIQYEKKAVSALEITDQCYVINSFSKFFSMTGWRVGWMVVPEDHIRVVERLAQNLFICPPHISQVAALEALSCENELSQYIEIYRKNRQIIMHELPQIGFQNFAPPDGAFYFYVDISRYSDDSLSFCDDVLEEVGVAITPGVDFDPVRGNTTIRISYARSTDEISEGINRLGNFMKKRGYF